jgi:uncharacterized membrane protein YeaQ/YmgE (transglycosylase-associated protein family)
LIVGVLAGFLYKALRLRLLAFLAASVLGAAVGGLNVAYLFRVPGAMDSFHPLGVLAAFTGAVLASALLHLLMPRKSPAL